MVKKDFTGRKFGYWTVVDGTKDPLMCKCVCKKVEPRLRNVVLSGRTKSCGCKKPTMISKRFKTHGLSKSRVYGTWAAMYTRCNNPNFKNASIYSEKGIKICKRWRKFENFFKDMGPPQKGKSLDRIDSNKGYSPKNCQWATPTEQARNTSRNKRVTFNGKTLCLIEWAEQPEVKSLGICEQLIAARLNKLGWSVEKTLTTKPVIGRNQHSIS